MAQLVSGVVAVAAAAQAFAQPAPSAVSSAGLWVPGGTRALLAAAALDPSRPRVTAILDIVHAIHDIGQGIHEPTDARRAALFAYLETLSDFERARAPFRSGTVRLSLATNKATRKVLEELASVLGSSLEEENHAYRLRPRNGDREQKRRERLLTAGFDVAEFEAALNGGEAVRLVLPGDEVPLPLPESVWRSLPFSAGLPDGPLVSAILGDRKASLLYYGLFSMDEESRQYLAATPKLVGEIYESDRVGPIALLGRSVRIRGGRVETPGGPAAASLWEAVAGEPVTRADRFLLKVLGKDGGRLALLYDVVAHLDPSHQAFALGGWLTDPVQRLEAFRALYAACVASLRGWDPAARPFLRNLYDPAHLLMLTRVLPDGRPGAINWRRLWDQAFESDKLPERSENDLKDLERDGLIDAAGMVAMLVPDNNNQVRRRRSETWLFGQRVFRDTPRSAIPQVLVVLRGYETFRALGDTLERLGITDPAVYVDAFRQAQRVTQTGDRERSATSLALYQGALVLVERACLSRAIGVPAAARLVNSLSRLELSADGEFLGAIAFWIAAEYLPAVGAGAGAGVRGAASGNGAPIETHVLRVMSGFRAGGTTPLERTLEHEGTRYRLDPVVPELARLQAVRGKQGGLSLDAVLGFAREVQAVAAGTDTITDVPARVKALKAAAEGLLPAASASAAGSTRPSEFEDTLAQAVQSLGRLRKPKDLAKIERIAVPLRRSVDRHLAPVLLSLAYACSLGEPDSTALLAGDPSGRHDWRVGETDDRLRLRAVWAHPTEARDATGRWGMKGSLLALDVGLGQLALRRISTEGLPGAPTITENDRRAFTEAVVLANPFDYRDADMRLIAGAMRRGRARVAGLVSAPALASEVLSEAGLDELRQQAVIWALVHQPEQVASFFSLGELLRLGRLAPDAVGALDAWGTSGLSFDGCLCLHFPMSQPLATLSGRRGIGLMPSLLPDLGLLVAEVLDEQGLPAMLTRSVLAAVTADVADRLPLAFEDDWMTMVAGIQRIVLPRMDDYLASVMTSGPLVPVPKGPEGGRVQ